MRFGPQKALGVILGYDNGRTKINEYIIKNHKPSPISTLPSVFNSQSSDFRKSELSRRNRPVKSQMSMEKNYHIETSSHLLS